MLKVWLGFDWDANRNPDMYFNNTYQEEWLDNELVKQMVKDIDNSEIVSRHCVNSPIFGQIAPEHLSGGVRGLILWLFDDEYYPDMIIFGENCCKWIAKIAKLRDIHGSLSGDDLWFEGVEEIDGIIENNGKEFHSGSEWEDITLFMDKNDKRGTEYE